MDKYEYQVKTEEMLQYMDHKDYRKAMEIADGIDWKHVKNVLMLCKVSEIYEYNRDYQRSREILFFAYDRRPNSRKIVYRLGTLALKLGDTDEAQDCYEEYVNLAPKDPNQYVLRYKIQKAKGVSLDEQIKTLEEFKKVEYIEKWAYELATLYHEAGRTEECLTECDDLILWFSEGKYVFKAMELKKRYKPLTPLQQEKYDLFVAEEEAKKAENKGKIIEEAQALAAEIQEELPAEYRDRDMEGIDIGADKNKILASQVDRTRDQQNRDPQVGAFAGLAQAFEAVTQGGAKIVEKITGSDQEDDSEPEGGSEDTVIEDLGEIPERVEEAAPEEPESTVDTAALSAAAGIDDLLESWESGQDPVSETFEEISADEFPDVEAQEAFNDEDLEELAIVTEDAPPEPAAEEAEPAVEEAEPAAEEAEPEAKPFEQIELFAEDAEPAAAEAEPVVEETEPEAKPFEQIELFAEEAGPAAEEAEPAAEEAAEAPEEILTQEEREIEEFEFGEDAQEEEIPAAEEPAEEVPAEPQKVGAKEISFDSIMADFKKDMEAADSQESDLAEEEFPEEEMFSEEEMFPVEDEFPEEDFDEVLSQEMAKTRKYSLHGEVDEDEFEDDEIIEEATEDLAARFREDDIFEDATEDFAEESFPLEDIGDDFEEDDFGEEGFEEDDFGEEGFEEDDFGEEAFEEADFGEENFAEADFGEEDFEEADFLEDFPVEELPRERASEDQFARRDPYEEDFDSFSEDDLPTGNLYDTDTIEIEDEIEDRMNQGGVSFDTGFVVHGRYDLETQSEIGLKAGLTQEQKELFSYFVPVQGMSEQIVTVLENDKKCTDRYGTSRTGNLLIIGHKGSGKTVLAVDIIKALQKNRNLEKGRVAIIDAEKLNHKDLNAIVDRLAGGALIIEQAADMSAETVEQLGDLMDGQTEEMFVVLEEQSEPLAQFLKQYPEFANKFTSKLEVPVFINDDLVAFGQTYAKENGYRIDEMGILALYSRIDALQREDHAVTVAEVKEIMDEAIAHSRRNNVKKLFKRNRDGSNRILLQETDFKR